VTRYRVEVSLGDGKIGGIVYVDADSKDDARQEAEEAVRNMEIEALGVDEA
jgi:hypothetical protein